ncbi:hypothetical protein N7474_008837 [Penicillium riverlandense]|uniref:uncharacterized protein n=1 Tax=Penicillium riverlandense TaxID=1903569 RepID=UPI0025470FD4|nr:uncharacterized protein N7474_008837 [Penicillium riverlandense]KAJ5812536.1 hypothetical protein N7474_008837 [Penicillium riverlandense]
MSTSQSPQPPTPKASRNNRKPKKNTTPQPQKTVMLSTPPSSPPRNVSSGDTTTDSSNPVTSSKKKAQRSAKKQPASRPSPAPNNNGHRHTSSQPGVMTPQLKDSAAYAGPTFHASPAPSALPIPSFFSKSFPDSDLAPTLETDSDNADMDPEIETTPSKPRSRPQTVGDEPKPTPLDFLFKAAVQARNSNSAHSPEMSRVRSPQTDSKLLYSNADNTPNGGVFSFEMENSGRSTPIGPSFAPSYQDRMNAFRASSSPSHSPADLNEDQRRLKTEELKHLLLNPRPQKPPGSSSSAHEQSGSFGANARPPHYATPLRTTSGPVATLSNGYANPQKQPVVNHAGRHPGVYAHPSGPQQFHYNSNSPLRREVPASNSHHSYSATPSPPAQFPRHNQPNYASPQPQYPSASLRLPANSPSPSQSPDTKKMEDDLRRILKLDAAPGIPPSGIQSSFA